MIAAFPMGLPAIYGGMLYANRHHLFTEDGEVSPSMKHLRFFFGEYEKHLYFWEVVRIEWLETIINQKYFSNSMMKRLYGISTV
jgi:hypothetical protein